MVQHPQTHCFVTMVGLLPPEERNLHHWISHTCRDMISQENPYLGVPEHIPLSCQSWTTRKGKIQKANCHAPKCPGSGSSQLGGSGPHLCTLDEFSTFARTCFMQTHMQCWSWVGLHLHSCSALLVVCVTGRKAAPDFQVIFNEL